MPGESGELSTRLAIAATMPGSLEEGVEARAEREEEALDAVGVKLIWAGRRGRAGVKRGSGVPLTPSESGVAAPLREE